MKNLGFRVPLAIVNKAHQANQLYPFAISLIESVRTYERSLEKLDNRPKIVLLLAGLHKEVQNLVAEGIGLVWESYKLDPYVQRFVCIFNQSISKVYRYRTRAIISRGLYIFYPIFNDHFFVFKEVFSENYVLMYGLYSRAACNQERLMMARVRYIL